MPIFPDIDPFTIERDRYRSYLLLTGFRMPHEALEGSGFLPSLPHEPLRAPPEYEPRGFENARMVSNFTLPLFRYSALGSGSIRLLRMIETDSGFAWELFDVDISTAPQYAALSYSWDGQVPEQGLNVHGSTLRVTRNVETVLPYLAKYSGFKCFWIDGICINQEDEKEKKVQIPLMHDIYTKAAKCIAWLGKSTFNIKQALQMVLNPSTDSSDFLEKLQNFDGRHDGLDQRLTRRGLPDTRSAVWVGFHDLFSSSWFPRLWVFQEAILPNIFDFMCGELLISFDLLAAVSISISRASLMWLLAPETGQEMNRVGMEKLAFTAVHRKHRQRAVRCPPVAFLNLLTRGQNWEVGQELDHVYGLLGLGPKLLQEHLDVSYNKKPADLYLSCVKYIVPYDKRMEVLAAANSQDPLDGLPTWCPNLSSPARTTTFGSREPSTSYSAWPSCAKVNMTLSADAAIMSIEGFRIDQIDEVIKPAWDYDKTDPQRIRVVTPDSLPWEAQCLKLSESVFSPPHTMPDAHWRTLIGNKHENGESYIGNGKKAYEMMKSWLASNQGCLSRQLSAGDRYSTFTDAEFSAVIDYHTAMHRACNGRSFFSTRGGRIGLGPSHTEPGDSVCIFYGGSTPYIIRLVRPAPKDASKYKYMFIGESYVDGIMQGEAVSNQKQEPETFDLL